MTEKSVAVEAAKEQKIEEACVLSTGVRARLSPVAASLVQQVTSKVEDPPVPMWFDEGKQRDVANPNDPAYLKALERTASKRGEAAMDAMILFGVELIDGLPEDDEWLKKLMIMSKLGHIDISAYDTSDPLEKEFLYKKFVAIASDDLVRLSTLTRLSEEDVQAAAAGFRGNEE